MSTDPDRGAAPRLRPKVTDAVVTAVLEELAEVGYGTLTMESVARRAGASKATLYRRWGAKQDMVLDAVAGVSQPPEPADQADGLRAVISEILAGVAAWLGDPMIRRILPDLLAEGLRSEAMGRALTTHIGEPRRAAVERALERSRAAGEVRPDVHLGLLLDLTAAPIYWRISGLRSEVDDEYLTELAELIHRYVAAP